MFFTERKQASDWIPGLAALGEHLERHGIPDNIVQRAIERNPWFSPYYIKRALNSITPWLQEKTLIQFLRAYPPLLAQTRRVGIITAGNLPLVGFHDVLMAVWAGHYVNIQASRKDNIILPWLIAQWEEIDPIIAQQISWNPQVEAQDFLIATGSNNSARYFQALVGKRDHIIRQNRYSVAILTGNETESALLGLCDDVFLYNGLGCRNVSNIVLLGDATLEPWLETLKKNPPSWLHPLYLERVLCVYAQRKALNQPTKGFPYCQIQEADHPEPTPMGILRVISVSGKGIGRDWISTFSDQLQCLVGLQLPFGMTQSPGIDQFADNVDTFERLTR